MRNQPRQKKYFYKISRFHHRNLLIYERGSKGGLADSRKKKPLVASVINEGEEADSCQVSVTANKSRQFEEIGLRYRVI